MKRTFLILGIALFAFQGAIAQKATLDKQEAIIAKQEETIQKLNELIELQKSGGQLSNEDLKNELTKMSYAYGVALGESFKGQYITEFDYNALNQGISDMLNGDDLLMKTTACQAYLNEYVAEQVAKQAEVVKAEGAAFLVENGKKEGVKTTESGLQYKVLKAADGPKPSADNKVKVHYHGTNIYGDVFDSSVDRGKPASFGLSQVIPGWTEGLQLMSTGSKYRLFIPSDLAYGDRGAGAMIRPGETLIFDVELLEIQE